MIDCIEQQEIPNTTTTTPTPSSINTISPLKEEDARSTTDIDNGSIF